MSNDNCANYKSPVSKKKMSYEDLLMTRSRYTRPYHNNRRLYTVHAPTRNIMQLVNKIKSENDLESKWSNDELSPAKTLNLDRRSIVNSEDFSENNASVSSKPPITPCYDLYSNEKVSDMFNKPMYTTMKHNISDISINEGFRHRFGGYSRQRQVYIALIFNGIVEHMAVSTAQILQMVHSHNSDHEPQNLAGGSLKLRDLRKLCSQSPGSHRAAIELRRNCILVNLLRVKCIILHEKLIIILHPNVNTSKEFDFIEKNESQHSSLIGKLVQISVNKNVGLFEFAAIESLLVEVCSYLADDLTPIIQASEKYNTTNAPKFSKSHDLQAISMLKSQVDTLADAIRDIYQALQELLNSEEDLRRMEVSWFYQHPEQWENPPHKSAAEDVEILLECYEQEIESMLRQIIRIDERLDDVLNIINLHLASIRNTFLKTEIGLDVLGTVFSFVSSITGVFGMNLLNGFGSDPYIFRYISQVVFGILVSAIIGTICAFYRMEV